MSTIQVGDRVRIPPDKINGYLVEIGKKLRDRFGVVEHVYTPQGDINSHVVVRWLKRGNRGREFVRRHYLDELEKIEVPA